MSFFRCFVHLLFVISSGLLITGCSTPRLFVNSDLPAIPSDVQFLVLPTDIHGLSGARAKKEAIFYQSFKSAFNELAIDTPQLESRLKHHGFGDVSWKMSHAMHRLVTEFDCFSYTDAYQLDLDDGEVSSKFRELDDDIYYLGQWLKQAYQWSDIPDYIAIAHIDSMGVSQAGRLIKYRVIAGIYSTQRKALERVVTYVTKSPNNHAAILHDLDNLGFLIYRELFKLN